jgi:hypothetical protein
MIDTDKYEGHTPVRKEWPSWCEDWLFSVYSGKTEDGSHTPTWNQDNALACDAPLLLAEVKRLREQVECSKGEHEWELDDYLDGDPNEPVRIVETCVACGLTRERIE